MTTARDILNAQLVTSAGLADSVGGQVASRCEGLSTNCSWRFEGA